MGLMINPAPTFTLNNGDIASEGKVYFYENGSTTVKKAVYLTPDLDPAQQLNNPLTLTDAGRLPTCFGAGTYTIVLESAAGSQQFVRNDVAIDVLMGQFSDYSTVKTYKTNEIVRFTDGNYYVSLQSENKGSAPAASSPWWSQITFLAFFNTAKATAISYMLNDIVVSGGFLYRSLENNNGDTPPSVKWANLTFNDSVAGDFTAGGNITSGGTVTAVSFVGGTLDPGYSKYAYKNTITSRASTTTQTADPDLVLAGLEPGEYAVEIHFEWNGNGSNTNGIKFSIGFNATGSISSLLALSPTEPGGLALLARTSTSTATFVPANAFEYDMTCIVTAHVTLDVGSSSLFLQWSQSSSGATATSISSGFITATRLA